MDTENIDITPDLLRSVDLESILSTCDKKECHSYFSALNKAAFEEKENNQLDKCKAISLFSALTSMYMKESNAKEPFGPMFVMEDKRTSILSDYSENDLNALAEIYEEFEDAELQARITDILWIRLRKPKFAETAVEAYLKSATVLEDPKKWSQGYKRIERALRLASLFRRQNPDLFNRVAGYIEEKIKKYDGKDPLFFTIKLLSILAEFNYGDSDRYFDLSCRIAQESHDNKNWHRAESAWEVAVEWSRVLKNEDKRHEVLAKLAETYAEQAVKGDRGLASSKFMQQAIEVYRKVPKSRERRNELYELLREFQKAARDNMQVIEGPEINLSESINKSREAVSGESFQDALFNFAFHIARPPKYAEVREQSIENCKKFIFSSIVGSVHLDQDGLVISEVPPLVGISGEEDAPAIWADMLRNISIHHSLDVQGAIEPARHVINFEHHYDVKDFFPLVQNNPFIPAGHEYIYAKGLCSGFHGDFIEASHLLVPQLENSFRYVLESNGIETTSLNTQGIQERIRIGTILKHEEIIKIFTEDIVLDLQALLIERKYGNLRNQITHGIMATNQFFQPSVIYLWWLILRLCLTPFYKGWSSKPDNMEESNTNSSENTKNDESQKTE